MEAVRENRERLELLVLALMSAKTNKKTCLSALHCCLTLVS
jgi:hypothetical protein